MKLIGEDEYGEDEDVFLNGNTGYDRSDSVEVGAKIQIQVEYNLHSAHYGTLQSGSYIFFQLQSQTGPVKRKRGRPKGSKNKPKDEQNFTADLSEDNEDVSVVNNM